MTLWYDGYRFCDDMQKSPMYNPLSTIACLNSKKFSNYWFSTGTPGFLIKLLRSKYSLEELRSSFEMSEESLGNFDINDIPLVTLLFQTGYLTITGTTTIYNEALKTSKILYKVSYPNAEVRESFKNYLILAFAHTSAGQLYSSLDEMRQAYETKNIELLCTTLRALFANIPHNLHISQERYYHSLFHLLCDQLGFKVHSESPTSIGRIDLTIETNKYIYVHEIKFNKTREEAIDQILQNRYYEKFLNKNKEIVLVGIAFNMKDKLLRLDWISQPYP